MVFLIHKMDLLVLKNSSKKYRFVKPCIKIASKSGWTTLALWGSSMMVLWLIQMVFWVGWSEATFIMCTLERWPLPRGLYMGGKVELQWKWKLLEDFSLNISACSLAHFLHAQKEKKRDRMREVQAIIGAVHCTAVCAWGPNKILWSNSVCIFYLSVHAVFDNLRYSTVETVQSRPGCPSLLLTSL